MEDAAKAIELAVGVIIFIVALTIGILLYNNLADTADNVLKINDTQNNIEYNEENIENDFGYIYSSEDIHYLIQDIKSGNELYSELEKIYIYKGHLNDKDTDQDVIDTNSKKEKRRSNIEATDVYDIDNNNSRYKIKCKYKYIKKDILTELNTHKPVELYIIKYVEDI